MTDLKRDQPDETATKDGKSRPAEAERDTDAEDRQRRKAAVGLLSPAIPPAGAGAMVDADPRLDDRSETEKALDRASSTPD